MEETTDCSNRFCVRFNDNRGLDTKFYKTNKTTFPNKLMRKLHYLSMKHVEQVSRGFSPASVAKKKKFQKFRWVSEVLKLKDLPKGFQSFSPKKRKKTVTKLVDELVDELAAAMSHGPVQGVDIQADSSPNMQVGAGSARQFDMTVGEDVGMQVNNPGQIQGDEVRAAAPNPDLGNTLSNDASLQNFAWNQWDNSQGRPPSRPPVPLADLVLIFGDLMHRASRFPGRLPKYEWSEEALRLFVNQLELLEGAFEDRSTTNFRSRQEEVYAPLPDFSAYEDVTSMPWMESLADQSLAEEIWSNLLTSPGRPEALGTSPNLYTG